MGGGVGLPEQLHLHKLPESMANRSLTLQERPFPKAGTIGVRIIEKLRPTLLEDVRKTSPTGLWGKGWFSR